MKISDYEIANIIERFVPGGRQSRYRDGGDRHQAETEAVRRLYAYYSEDYSQDELSDAEARLRKMHAETWVEPEE